MHNLIIEVILASFFHIITLRIF